MHRGIKGEVKDTAGNGIKGATVSVRGIRKDVTTGKVLDGCDGAQRLSIPTVCPLRLPLSAAS